MHAPDQLEEKGSYKMTDRKDSKVIYYSTCPKIVMPKEEEGSDYGKPNVKAIIDDAVSWVKKS